MVVIPPSMEKIKHMTADEIYAKLREIAPSIAFSASREHDHDEIWDGDGPDPAEDGYTPYVVEVNANVIINGEFIESAAYLGGSYYQYDEPLDDVHGYLPQMLEEAATELYDEINIGDLKVQLSGVITFLKNEMRERYDAQ